MVVRLIKVMGVGWFGCCTSELVGDVLLLLLLATAVVLAAAMSESRVGRFLGGVGGVSGLG